MTKGYDRTDSLSKREYFAAMAMQGVAANSAVRSSNAGIAQVAVCLADALILALNESEKAETATKS